MITNLELHTKLSNLFHVGFNFITAENIPKPKWRTNRKYRLTRGEFVKRYSDELTLLGVSFGSTTKYFMLDIDRGSKYHPDNDLKAFQKLRQILEKIGIVRVDIIRSSHSQGIHLYGCLPERVSTIRLATLLHVTLIDAGIDIAKGQLECFPNPKPYGAKGCFTYYNPHRVPLQPNTGSLLLDEDGSILLNAENLTHENMLSGFLTRAEQSAQAQDMELLHRLMDACYAKYTSNKGIAKYQHHHKDYSEVAREWKENLEWTIQTIGWTAHGQTNTLLPNFIAYGVVFLGLKGEELKNCLYDLILAAPGYQEYCRHKHEIKSVIKDWVENTERQGYYVEYCGFPARSGLNPYITAKRIKANRNEHNENMTKRTEQRLNAILAALTEIPNRVGAKIAAIRAKSLELFGEAISRNTLYKPAYKSLWFGSEIARDNINLAENPTPPSNCTLTVTNQQAQPITLENNILNSSAQNQSEPTLSHTPPIYETFVGRVRGNWLHHQLQLHCINLFCISIIELQSLSVSFESESDFLNPLNLDFHLQPTSVELELQNLPVQNIHSTEDFKNTDLQSEEVEISAARSVVEIARQMRINLATIPDPLLLEFLHHPELEAIEAIVELANKVAAADSSDLVAGLVADLSHRQKLDLWGVLSADERGAVERLMARSKSVASGVEAVVEDVPGGSVSKLVVGATVSTLTGLVGVIKYVFQSIAQPFLVYHESIGRTILYAGDVLRLNN